MFSFHKRSTTRGYTLLELIVSVALFTIVVTIAMGTYLQLISLNRKARATNDLVSNLSYTLESMGRSIRTGKDYDCGGDGGAANCWPGGSSQMAFTDENSQNVTYRLKSGGSVGVCINTACTDTSAATLTDPRITINSLQFFVQGVGTGDGTQPRVIIAVSGQIIPEPDEAPISFSIQTSATQRLIEI